MIFAIGEIMLQRPKLFRLDFAYFKIVWRCTSRVLSIDTFHYVSP